MEAYIARQPIFDKNLKVTAYELLYRDGENKSQAVFTDGNKATSRLLSDAITLFGLPHLTNSKPAFVNFTDTLILNNFVCLAPPQDIIVEVLEDAVINPSFIQKLIELREKGYRLALDDYTGNPYYKELLPLIDYLKVDFLLTDARKQAELAGLPKRYPQMHLLAEKVETEEEFDRAVKQGYRYFQGYFFSKPKTLHKKVPSLSTTSYGLILAELNRKGGINFSSCAKIIHRDALMTYRILQKVHTLEYYRGNMITAVRSALVMMGENEVRRWILLILARDNNVTHSDELVRQAYLRGVFAKELMDKSSFHGDSENAFLLGMFSVLDKILGLGTEEILADIVVPPEVRAALLHKKESFYTELLDFVCMYEGNNHGIVPAHVADHVSDEEISRIYMDSVVKTDEAFNEIAL